MGKKKAKCQRHTDEELEFYADEEFNMFETFSRIAAINLRTLKKKAPGVPSDLCLRDKEDIDSIDVKLGMKRWHKILDKMIWSFDEIAADNPNEPEYFGKDNKESKVHKKYWKRVNKGLDLFRDRFFDLVMY